MIIKSFKIFEMTVTDLSNEIDDFLLYFQDEGYQIENRYRYGGGIGIWRNHHPSEHSDGKSIFKKISDDFFRLVDYLLSHLRKVVINVEMIVEKKSNRLNIIGYDTPSIGFIIHRGEKDWEDRLLKDIGENTKIRSISIEI